MMVEKEILKALQKGVLAAVAQCTNPNLPIKMIGINITPPNDGKWLEVVHVPNNINNEFWDDSKTYRGIFRLILHWPMDSKGIYEAMNLISDISRGFIKGKSFSSDNVKVMIYENPDLTGVIEEPPQSMLPLSVRYMSFQQSA